jgi:hypothetical protein
MLRVNPLVGFGARKVASAVSAPVVEATNISNNDPATNSHSVSLPAGLVSGDLLIVAFNFASISGSVTTPAGWTLVSESTSSFLRKIFSRVSDGLEGGTLSVSSSAAARSAHNSYRISNYTGTGPEAAINEGGADPPSLNPSWGSLPTLFIPVVMSAASDWNITAPPANYSNLLQAKNSSSSATSRCGVGSARRTLTADSDDPGTFTLTGAFNGPISFTLAVQGA